MSQKTAVVAIIPARFASTRFPGKALAALAGKPMIQHVYERVRRASAVSEVLVATDDERIRAAVEKFGGRAEMTSGDHPSGTDRVAEAAAGLKADVVVNVQGDEPLIDPRVVDQAVQPMLDDPELEMSTLGHGIEDPGDLTDPDVVKVRVDRKGYALDFLRLPQGKDERSEDGLLKHIGLYAFRRPYLLYLTTLEPTGRERALGLEQLRPLEHGCRIRVVVTEYGSLGVDRPRDLERAEKILSAQKEVLS